MEDLISRQAAIEAVSDYIHNVDKVIGTGKLSKEDCRDAAESVLEELPSALPEIIRCKDCRHRMATPDGDAWICAHPNNNAWSITDDHYCGYAEKQDMREDHDGSLDEGVK